MQLFVRCLDSRTRVCDVEPSCSVEELKQQIRDVEGVPCCSQGLVFAGRQLEDARSLVSYGVTSDSTLHLVLRLRGGKGGFGALLRGLGRDGSKTTNNDAMRDLQGRRLKHANAEQKLREWKEKEKERELEKIAMKHIKEQERQAKRERENEVEVGSIVEAQRVTVARVQDAVQAALANGTSGNKAAAAAAGPSAAGAKRPANGSAAGSKAAAAAGPVAKRSRMMAAIESFGSDDGSDSSSEGEDA
ncbi:hypothetical protein CHLRE_07g322100v5 [Chlamydomonas reinhardtii]|uniref:Uncharacterized protein n=1 Tax=Chlamydomonas reinhardtii TaxID=3055 RepID=A8I788_CHLRE|nr:uncharacterized protein CHLRE_07g322100v5 [Chlamydomonas reinhardtii]PNW80547.1 hypothetical protein CHLRE_07g322100v5 [Chlamydomonas reinhardtii]|eukprot:XP_001701052.1 ubiquitin fusion protein [Chlamydomonas reinhardtii]